MSDVVCPLCRAEDTWFLHRSDDRHGVREFYECAVCDLAFVPPEFHLPSIVERDRYLMHDNNPADAGYREFLARLWNVLRPYLQEGESGLDFGCGPGPALAEMIREDGFDVALYDIYFFPDTTALERTYDFIACTETVEHLRDPRAGFQQLNDLLRPGGKIGIMTGVLEGRSKFGTWYYHRDPTHIAFYAPQTFRWIADWLDWELESQSKNVAVFSKRL